VESRSARQRIFARLACRDDARPLRARRVAALALPLASTLRRSASIRFESNLLLAPFAERSGALDPNKLIGSGDAGAYSSAFGN
jgi:hypothetical protein